MKKSCILLSALLLVLCSCSQSQEETALRYDAETKILEDGVTVYLEDYYEKGRYIAEDYYLWRNEGNPPLINLRMR